MDPTIRLTDDELAAGRALTRVNLWRIFGVSALVALLSSRSSGDTGAAWLRLLAIGLSCLLVYKGLRWALWLLGLLTVLAGAAMMVVGLMGVSLHWTDRVVFSVGGAVQVLAFLILLKAPEVRSFMEHQRHPDRGPTDAPPGA